ncbi:lens fiber major intrinsic protein-like [Engraulis encrasicolus]|uniref:lens fiber major intrinsic protein-like n=1 Tax=Engraulis encrasicolus TaxID=184585 RepID=UPI002FD1A2C8
MNPARSFASAMFKRNLMNHWVYWAGPMICGTMGAIMYDFMLFPRMCGLAERMATMKGAAAPPEAGHRWGSHQAQDPGPISLPPSQGKDGPARLIIVAPQLLATQLSSSNALSIYTHDRGVI